MEDVAGETFGVHANENAGVWTYLAENERDVLVLIHVVAVTDDAPGSALHWEASFRDPMHETLRLEPVRHELSDGDEGQVVLLGEPIQLRSPGARPIFAQDLANDAGGDEAGESGKIHSRFSMSNALEDSAFPGTKRRHVPRTAQVGWHGLRIHGNTNGLGAILGAYTSSNAKFLVSIDADCESGPVLVGVVFGLLGQLELVGAGARQGEADPSTCLPDHEIDHFGRHELRRANEIALILAILVIRHDDQLAGLDVGNRLLDCSERHVV
jgi:hypothetical protein